MPHASVLRVFAALAVLSLAPAAGAFDRETTTGLPYTGTALSWCGRTIHYRINAAAVTATGCGTREAAEAAISSALASWGVASQDGVHACTDLEFVPDSPSTTSRIAVANDGVNLIVVRKGLCGGGQSPNVDNCWNPANGLNTIGYTTNHYDSDGRIVDSDMELYAWDGTHGFNFTCAAPGDPPCGSKGVPGCNETDLQAVALHEAGHMLGLAHVCTNEWSPAYLGSPTVAACPATPPVMEPQVGTVSERALQPDDVAGVCSIYPKGGAARSCSSPDGGGKGGCSSAGGVGIAGLLALLAAARRRRA